MSTVGLTKAMREALENVDTLYARSDKFVKRMCDLGLIRYGECCGLRVVEITPRGHAYLATPAGSTERPSSAYLLEQERGPCSIGVGCDESGVCYAAAHGEPDRCPNAAPTASAPADAPVVAWMLRNTETGEIYWDETECLWSDAASANEAADGLNENVVGGDAEGPWEAIPLYTTPQSKPACDTPAPASGAVAPIVAVSDEDVTIAIARALAIEDGYDTADKDCGLFDLRWSGGTQPEPLGTAWGMDYMPKAERIAESIALESFASRHASKPAGAVSDAALCDFATRWRLDGDYLRCTECDAEFAPGTKLYTRPSPPAVAVGVSEEDLDNIARKALADEYRATRDHSYADAILRGRVSGLHAIGAIKRALRESFANRRAAQGERHE